MNGDGIRVRVNQSTVKQISQKIFGLSIDKYDNNKNHIGKSHHPVTFSTFLEFNSVNPESEIKLICTKVELIGEKKSNLYIFFYNKKS